MQDRVMTDSVSDAIPGLSEILVQARADKGLTLESVSEQLNLSITQLEKLEQPDLNLADLTTFERGYIRNYARLLDVDIKGYESVFPDGENVGADLQSVQRYSYKANQPIITQGWLKFIILMTVLIVAVWLFLESGIDLSDINFSQGQDNTADMPLPAINNE